MAVTVEGQVVLRNRCFCVLFAVWKPQLIDPGKVLVEAFSIVAYGSQTKESDDFMPSTGHCVLIQQAGSMLMEVENRTETPINVSCWLTGVFSSSVGVHVVTRVVSYSEYSALMCS